MRGVSADSSIHVPNAQNKKGPARGRQAGRPRDPWGKPLPRAPRDLLRWRSEGWRRAPRGQARPGRPAAHRMTGDRCRAPRSCSTRAAPGLPPASRGQGGEGAGRGGTRGGHREGAGAASGALTPAGDDPPGSRAQQTIEDERPVLGPLADAARTPGVGRVVRAGRDRAAQTGWVASAAGAGGIDGHGVLSEPVGVRPGRSRQRLRSSTTAHAGRMQPPNLGRRCAIAAGPGGCSGRALVAGSGPTRSPGRTSVSDVENRRPAATPWLKDTSTSAPKWSAESTSQR
jgi:hypothetical protein